MATWRSQAEAEHERVEFERLRADREARRADLAVEVAHDAQARLAYLERKLFGRQSERFVDPNQQELVFTTNGEDEAEEVDDGQTLPTAADASKTEARTITVTRRKRGGGGRQKIDPRLKRIDIEHTLPADQLIDPGTGEVIYEPFGTRITEKLAYTPPQLHVERHLHVKYRLIQGGAAPAERLIDSDLPEVRMAPPTTEGLPRCLAAPSLLAELLYAKYVLHLPFDRKLKDLKRQSGVTLAPTSVCRWAQDVAELLTPLILLMKTQMFARSKVIQHDDTPVNQLPVKQSKRQKCITARFWSAVGQSDTPGAYVVYDYTDGRSREGPQAWFSDDQGQPLYTGYLQGDRYAGYDSLAGIGKGQEKWSMTLVGCWAHARRKFHDQRQNYPGDALKALSMIQGLYKVEEALRGERKEAEQAGVFDATAWPARRQAVRQEEAATQIDGFFDWCRDRQATLRPKHVSVPRTHPTYPTAARSRPHTSGSNRATSLGDAAGSRVITSVR